MKDEKITIAVDAGLKKAIRNLARAKRTTMSALIIGWILTGAKKAGVKVEVECEN